MRNQAKCNLCKSIIESFHADDLVECKCGEIYVYGGNAMFCGAKNWQNFLRVDDKGNEILVKLQENVKPLYIEEDKKLNKEDILGMVDRMIDDYQRLPEKALYDAVTHSDLLQVLMLLSAALKA